MTAEIKRLQNRAKGQEELLRKRTSQMLKLEEDLKVCTQGYEELKVIVSAFLAYIAHKNGGRLNLYRKKINDLMGKYSYDIVTTEEKFVIKEKRR